MFNVQDLYTEAHKQSEPLLSSYEEDWWEVYVDNYEYFDRLFMKTYRSFIPFNAIGDNIEAVTVDFTQDCFNWLLANDKRYSELYRLQLVDDDEYNFMFNYDMTETFSGTTSSSGSETLGQRQDSHTGSKTAGGHTDTHNNDITYGAVSNSDETKVSAFNESGYSNKEKTDHTEAQKIDQYRATDTIGSRTDSDSATDTKGSQQNSSTSSGTEGHTMTRQGNIGVETTSDIMRKHVDLWKAFNFYKIVFDDIANEFLRV